MFDLLEKLLKVFQESKHSHDRCMECSSVPEVEILWAEGMGHCWFCMKCFKKWATEGDGKGDVCAVKKVVDGKASKNWKDNSSPNIMNTLDFLKEAIATAIDPEVDMKKKHKKILNTKLVSGTFVGEEHYFKFWLMTDGSHIPVEYSHEETANLGRSSDKVLKEAGVIAGSISHKELFINGDKRITKAQISKLKQMSIEYGVVTLMDYVRPFNFQVKVKSPKELVYYLEYGKEKWEAKRKNNV